jgi:hypothetical protein
MASYLYVKTCYNKEDGNRKLDKYVRVRVLGGQKDRYGNNLNVTMNVSCKKSIRIEYPIGTIFGFPIHEFQKREKFYKVLDNKLTPVEVDGELQNDNWSMMEDYNTMYPYMKNEERKLVLDWILSDSDIPLT